ncbi:MAG: guanylate kinase, partial [Leptotrichiaceae bacterium]
INSGQNVILEIDVQGGIIVKEKNSEAILVFFKAPNMEVLAKRLEDRKTDTKDVIELRLANAKKELEYEKEYDYTVVNDNLEKACQELINIINK